MKSYEEKNEENRQVRKEIGELVLLARKKAGYSYYHFLRSGLHQCTIEAIEQGESCQLNTLITLLNNLDLEIKIVPKSPIKLLPKEKIKKAAKKKVLTD